MAIIRPTRKDVQRAAGAVRQEAFEKASEGLAALNLSGKGYDRIIDAMNRLPRPAMMLLTVALFGYASLDPAGFAARMQALAEVPEPLWWLQGAVLTLFFGAREAHYLRLRKPQTQPQTQPQTPANPG